MFLVDFSGGFTKHPPTSLINDTHYQTTDAQNSLVENLHWGVDVLFEDSLSSDP